MRFRSKSLLAFLALVFISSNLLVAYNSPMGKAQAGTSVNGIIYSDTTWTQANSPYSLTANVLVENGVTLTITAGVTVNLNSYYIMVNGTLQTLAATDADITFVGGTIIFTQYSAAGNTSQGCIMQDVTYNPGTYGSGSIFVDGGSPLILDCNLGVGITYDGGSPVISNNNMTAAGFTDGYGRLQYPIAAVDLEGGTIQPGTAFIENNVISGPYFTASIIIFGSNCFAEGNLITENRQGVGISVTSGWVTNFSNNTVTFCGQAISARGYFGTFAYNNLQNNTYNVYLTGPNSLGSIANLNATYNWWGTTDSQAISQTIHDFYSDYTLATVYFTPFLTAPNPQAPSVNEVVTNPTPTPTQSPSQNPTKIPTQTPTTTTAVPELSLLAIVPLFLSVFSVAVILRHRKAVKLKQ